MKIESLPKRDNYKDIFSQWIFCATDNNELKFQWKIEPDLRRNFNLYANNHELFQALLVEKDLDKILKLLIDIALQRKKREEWESTYREKYALWHLNCYCEETLYYVARKLIGKVGTREDLSIYLTDTRYNLLEENRLLGIIENYNPENAKFSSYMSGVFKNIIRDISKICKYSNLRLLIISSKKNLKNVLENQGIIEPEISRIIFAIEYFKEIYRRNHIQIPDRKGNRYPEPDENDYELVVKSYNSEKKLSSTPWEVFNSKDATVDDIIKWIEICINALRQSNSPPISLDLVEQFPEERNENVSDESLSDISDKDKIKTVISCMNEQQKITLIYYYGFGFNQRDTAQLFQVDQTAISQRLSTIRRKFIKNIKASINLPQWVDNYVSNWLAKDYQSPNHQDLLQKALVKAARELDNLETEFLRLYYGEKMSMCEISSKLNIREVDINKLLKKIQADLEEQAIYEIDNAINKFFKKRLPSFLKKQILCPACKNLMITYSESSIKNIKDLETINNILEESLKIIESFGKE